MGEAIGSAPRQFQVDLGGVISLLSRNLYSSPGVYLRELLQNAHDALTARSRAQPGHAGGIRIVPIDVAAAGSPVGQFAITDDGIGLTLSDVEALLSTVGASSKRDILQLPRRDFLGQFGIGLLSCFLVAEQIVVTSRSALGGRAVEWVGSSDGTYTAREFDDDLPVGTTVRLTPRAENGDLLASGAVSELATRYAEFLPSRITIATVAQDRSPTRRAPFLLGLDDASHEVLEYGERIIGRRPFAAVPIRIASTETRGYAYVLPFASAPSSVPVGRVYLGGMLVTDRQEDLAPDWAFFARVVIDSRGLHPTASREALVRDDALAETREQIGLALRTWIMELGARDPRLLDSFIETHSLALKMMALHDPDFARFVLRWIPVETSSGRLPIGELVHLTPEVRYARTIDEFRQIAGFARVGRPLVNGGYVFDSELLELLPANFTGVTVEAVDVLSEIDELAPPPLDDRGIIAELERRATAILLDQDCEVVVRSFGQSTVTAVFLADPAAMRRIDRGRTRSRGTGPTWATVLQRVDELASQSRPDDGLDARLCLNWSNPVVRGLARVQDGAVFVRLVQLLYVQALMAGHHPLAPRDHELLSTALTDLMTLSIGIASDPESA